MILQTDLQISLTLHTYTQHIISSTLRLCLPVQAHSLKAVHVFTNNVIFMTICLLFFPFSALLLEFAINILNCAQLQIDDFFFIFLGVEGQWINTKKMVILYKQLSLKKKLIKSQKESSKYTALLTQTKTPYTCQRHTRFKFLSSIHDLLKFHKISITHLLTNKPVGNRENQVSA